MKESRRVAKKKPAKPAAARNGSPASGGLKANNAGASPCGSPLRLQRRGPGAGGWWRAALTPGSGLLRAGESGLVPADANFRAVAAEPEASGPAGLSSVPSQDQGAEDKPQVGLASVRGAAGTRFSAGVALELGFVFLEIGQAVLLQGASSSPLGCELQGDGRRGPGDRGDGRQQGSVQGHPHRAAGHPQAAGGRARAAAPPEALQEGQIRLDRRGEQSESLVKAGSPCGLPPSGARWVVEGKKRLRSCFPAPGNARGGSGGVGCSWGIPVEEQNRVRAEHRG